MKSIRDTEGVSALELVVGLFLSLAVFLFLGSLLEFSNGGPFKPVVLTSIPLIFFTLVIGGIYLATSNKKKIPVDQTDVYQTDIDRVTARLTGLLGEGNYPLFQTNFHYAKGGLTYFAGDGQEYTILENDIIVYTNKNCGIEGARVTNQTDINKLIRKRLDWVYHSHPGHYLAIFGMAAPFTWVPAICILIAGHIGPAIIYGCFSLALVIGLVICAKKDTKQAKYCLDYSQ